MSGSSERAFAAGRWLFAAVVPGAALALGTLPIPCLFVIAMLSGVALMLVSMRPAVALSRGAAVVVAIGVALTAWTALQVVPLPVGLTSAIAPRSAELWASSLTPLGEGSPATHALSVAPLASLAQVLRGLLYVSVFLTAMRISSEHEGVSFLQRAIVWGTVAMAILALAHPAVGADKVLGIYRPREIYAYRAGHYAPLLNPNHLAAYLNLGACLTFASLLRRKPLFDRSLSAVFLLILVGTSIWAGSRGGTSSLVFGLGLAGLGSFLSRRHYVVERKMLPTSLVLALAAIGLLAIGQSESAQSDLTDRSLGKLEIIRSAFGLVRESPWVGFGRGAFEDVFPLVNHESVYMTSSHAENLVAQWATEWGVPATVLALGGLGWVLRPQWVLASVRPEVGAWSAIVATVLHDLVDFHLEVPGITIAVATCMAMVLARRGAEAPTMAFGWMTWGPRGVGLLTLCVAVAVVVHGESSLSEQRHLLSDEAGAPGTTDEVFRRDLRAAISRHPAEGFFPLMGAVRAQTHGTGSVTAWIGNALERNPRFGRAHFVLAQHLASRNRAQARLEYRLAYSYDDALRGPVMAEAPRLVTSFNEAMELVPEEQSGRGALDRLGDLLSLRLPATSAQIDVELLSRWGPQIGPLTRQARGALSDIANHHPWCDVGAPSCESVAVATAKAAVAADDQDCSARLLLARSELASPGVEEHAVLDTLAEAAALSRDRVGCMQAVVLLAFERGDDSIVDAELARLANAESTANSERADLFIWMAEFEDNRRHRCAASIGHYRRAFDLAPDRDEPLRRVVRIAPSCGRDGEAIDAAELLVRRHPEDRALLTTLEDLRRRARLNRAAGQYRP